MFVAIEFDNRITFQDVPVQECREMFRDLSVHGVRYKDLTDEIERTDSNDKSN